MIKLKNKKLLLTLLGASSLVLPIAVISCTPPARVDTETDVSQIAKREDFTPKSTVETKENVTTTTYQNNALASLFINHDTEIGDLATNESLWEGIKKASDDYNEFRRIHTPTETVKYDPKTDEKKAGYYIPVLNFLDNYQTGYTLRSSRGNYNVLVVNGARQSKAIKAWLWEAKNVDTLILNDEIQKVVAERGKIQSPTEEQKKAFDKRISGFQDRIDKINNLIVVAVGFDPSTSEEVEVFKYTKREGDTVGTRTSERTKENYAIPSGQWIHLDPGTTTGEGLHKFLGASIYNILLDLDSAEDKWVVLNKGGSAKNEKFVQGTTSIKLVP